MNMTRIFVELPENFFVVGHFAEKSE